MIATARLGTELGDVVGQVGIAVAPGDQSALCQAILDLASAPEHRHELGQKGYDYVCGNWSEKIVLSRFESQLQETIQE